MGDFSLRSTLFAISLGFYLKKKQPLVFVRGDETQATTTTRRALFSRFARVLFSLFLSLSLSLSLSCVVVCAQRDTLSLYITDTFIFNDYVCADDDKVKRSV